jgi:hypothetical protein
MAELPTAAFKSLADFLDSIPAIKVLSNGSDPDDGAWWIKLNIDIGASHAWNIVQELGHILNLLSVNDRLPTVFKPVSAPPYMNGGPSDFLSWVIECPDPEFRPGTVQEWLEGRLPQPASDIEQWLDLDD